MASSVVYLDGKVDAANVTTNTFTGVNFGTAASDRQIGVFIGARPNVFATATVTIGGVTATLVEQVAWTTSGATQLLYYVADVPTGTSGTIEIAWSTINNRCGIEVYGLYGLTGTTLDVTAELDADGTFSPFTLSSAAHVIGAVFSIASTNRTARISGASDDLASGSPTISFTAAETNISWTGLTEDHDATVEVLGGTGFLGAPAIIAAYYTVAGGPTYTLTVDAASYTLTAANVALKASRSLAVNAASYTLTTADVGLKAARVIAPDAAQYTLTGADVAITAARKLPVDTVAYSLTAADVTLTYSPAGAYTLAVDAASYAATFGDVALVYTPVASERKSGRKARMRFWRELYKTRLEEEERKKKRKIAAIARQETVQPERKAELTDNRLQIETEMMERRIAVLQDLLAEVRQERAETERKELEAEALRERIEEARANLAVLAEQQMAAQHMRRLLADDEAFLLLAA